MGVPYFMINEVIGCSKNVSAPKVGMLGTYFVGSDRYGVVVAKVISPKKIFVIDVHEKELASKFTDDNGIEWLTEEFTNNLLKKATPSRKNYARYGEDAKELYEWDMKRFEREGTYTFRKNGRWIEAGHSLNDCCAIHLGVADPYRDPCF